MYIQNIIANKHEITCEFIYVYISHEILNYASCLHYSYQVNVFLSSLH